MNDPVYDNLPLIAQNEEHHQQDSQHGETRDAAHGGGHGEAEGNAFKTLLASLGDHREIEVGPLHIVDLPVILIDDGFHFYASTHAMEEDGEYVLLHNFVHDLPADVKANWTEAEVTKSLTDHKTIIRVPENVTSTLKRSDLEVPALDVSITSVVAYQWMAMLLLMAIFIPMARKYRKLGARSQKGFFNAMESVVEYVRDNVVIPNVGTGKVGMSLTPVLLTYFFFILTMNLTGMVPGGHSATGSLSVTAGLAVVAFFVIQYAAIRQNGFLAWVKHLTGGTPKALWPIMIPVEIMGLFAKPFALCVRLFANMTGGHVVILSLVGLIFVSSAFIPVTVGFSAFINLLELLVAFIQAYIFTILVGVFSGMGMASHDHGHDEHHADDGKEIPGVPHAVAH